MKLTKPNKRTLIASPTEKKKKFLTWYKYFAYMCQTDVFTTTNY